MYVQKYLTSVLKISDKDEKPCIIGERIIIVEILIGKIIEEIKCLFDR